MKKNKYKIIKNQLGNIEKIISKNEKYYKGFNELYITNLNKDKIKGWNMHKKMTLNLFVIKGKVKFHLKQKKILKQITLSEDSKEILTVKPKTWLKMKNLYNKKSKIINFANLKHNKNEIVKKNIL